MARKLVFQFGVVALTSVVLFGCQSQKMNMDDMMKPAVRPLELDHLNMFLGTWEGMADITMAGSEKVEQHKGKITYEWMLDKWVLVERDEYEMGEGKTGYMTGYWRWDPDEQNFNMVWFCSDGGFGSGVARYNEQTKTWTFKGKSNNPYQHMKTLGEGKMTFVDDKTIEWTWEEDLAGLFGGKDFMEMKGTLHKQ